MWFILEQGRLWHTETKSHLCDGAITQEKFVDPMVAADGESYERDAIQMWLSEHGGVSPTTGKVMRHTDLLPNHTLRSIMSSRKHAQ